MTSYSKAPIYITDDEVLDYCKLVMKAETLSIDERAALAVKHGFSYDNDFNIQVHQHDHRRNVFSITGTELLVKYSSHDNCVRIDFSGIPLGAKHFPLVIFVLSEKHGDGFWLRTHFSEKPVCEESFDALGNARNILNFFTKYFG